jgi:hypothetical protein
MVLSITFTCFAGLTRGLFLALDPYGYVQSIPIVVSRWLMQLTYPCITCSFGLIQLIQLRLTRLDVGTSRVQNPSFIMAVTCVYFAFVLLTEIIVFFEADAKVILLFHVGYFIVWSTYVCVTFIDSGFRLTHYTSETQKADKE